MLVLAESNYGSIVCGRVEKIKLGSGNASGRLTIVTVTDFTTNGQPKEDRVKILFWNPVSGHGSMLADRARRLIPGDYISARIVFDVGDPGKAVGFEFKKSGHYKCKDNADKEVYIVHGQIAKIVKGDRYLGAYIPVPHLINGNWETQWYLISFWNSLAKKAEHQIRKGDTVFVRGFRLEKKEYENYQYLEMSGIYVKQIHKY